MAINVNLGVFLRPAGLSGGGTAAPISPNTGIPGVDPSLAFKSIKAPVYSTRNARIFSSEGFNIFKSLCSAEGIDSDLSAKSVQDFLKKTKMRIFDPAKNNAVKKMCEGLIELTNKLRLSKDGRKPIHIFISDDMDINARFTKLESGEKLLLINLGLLNFVETDDELAYLLGHELEHGTSELQEYIKELESRQNGEDLYTCGLKRAVETEVDIKSALKRVHGAGLNPHGAVHVLSRFIARFGDNVGTSHTSISSRKDGISIAITAAQRGWWKDMPEDRPSAFTNKLIRSFHENLTRTPEFRANQIQRARRSIKNMDVPVEELLMQIKKGKLSKRHIGLSFFNDSYGIPKYYYDGEFCKKFSELKTYLTGLISDEEWMELELDLHARLHRHFEEARIKVFGKDFEQMTMAQYDQILSFYTRLFVPSLTRISITAQSSDKYILDLWLGLEDAEKELLSLKKSLASAEGDEQEKEIEAKIEAAEAKIRETKKKYNYLLLSFEKDAEPIIKRIAGRRALLRNKQNSQSSERLQMENEADHELLSSKQRIIGALKADLNNTMKKLHTKYFDAALKNSVRVAALSHFIDNVIKYVPELIRNDPVRVLNAYNVAMRREARSSTLISETVKEFAWFWTAHDSYRITGMSPNMEVLEMAMARDRDAVHRYFREYVRIMIEYSDSAGPMDLILKDIGRPYEDDQTEPFLIHGSISEGIFYSPELARAIFEPELVTDYLEKLEVCHRTDFGNTLPEGLHLEFVTYEGMNLLTNYCSKIEILKRHGLFNLPPQKRAHIYRISKRLLSSAVSFFINTHISPTGKKLTALQAKSIIFATIPKTRALYDRKRDITDDDIMKNIITISFDMEFGQICAHTIDYYQLHGLFGDMEDKVERERFFNFAYRVRGIVSFFPQHSIDYKDVLRTFDYLKMNILFSDWVGREYPNDYLTRHRILDPNLPVMDVRATQEQKVKMLWAAGKALTDEHFRYLLKLNSKWYLPSLLSGRI